VTRFAPGGPARSRGAGAGRRDWRSRLASFLVLAGAVAAAHLVSHLTGFGDWLEGSPAAIGVLRAIFVLVFGGCAFAILFLRDDEDGSFRFRDWFYAASALAITVANAALLIGGEDAI
jgi:hypothetical protein